MPYGKPVVTPDWMRLREAAQQLGCAPNTLRCRIRAGKLPDVRVIQIDNVLRVHREDWARHMEQGTPQPEKVA